VKQTEKDKRIDRLTKALWHCINAIEEWENDPEGAEPFLFGAMDSARAILGEYND
jgi:hypothetical protein